MTKRKLKEIALRHPDEILQPFGDMLKMNGFDAICAITDYYGGSSIYVPKTRSIFIRCIEEEIRAVFRGDNIKELSKEYGFTERHLRRLVGKP